MNAVSMVQGGDSHNEADGLGDASVTGVLLLGLQVVGQVDGVGTGEGASVSNEQWGSSIRAMHEGERPKPLPPLKTVYVVVYVSVH